MSVIFARTIRSAVVWRIAPAVFAASIGVSASIAGAQENSNKRFEVSPVSAGARRAEQPDSLSIGVSLITVGPGTDKFSWFGHAGIMLTYPGSGEQLEFDYGVMRLSRETTRELLVGAAGARASMSDGHVALAEWARLGRDVTIQRLNLTDAQRDRLIELLVADRSPRRTYRYNLLTDNCTTRIRDLLDLATDGALSRAGASNTGMTIRDLGARQLKESWLIAAFDLMLNDEVDFQASRWDAAILPAELSELVAATSLIGINGKVQPLVRDRQSLRSLPVSAVPIAANRYSFLLVGSTSALLMILMGMWALRGGTRNRVAMGLLVAFLGGAFGLLGSALTAIWIFTAYPFAKHNLNVLVLNPLLLFAAPLGIAYAFGHRTSLRILRRLLSLCALSSVVALIVTAASMSDQDNIRTLLLAAPAIAGLACGVCVAEGHQFFGRFGRMCDTATATGHQPPSTTRSASFNPIFLESFL